MDPSVGMEVKRVMILAPKAISVTCTKRGSQGKRGEGK